jgi:hypothetical protein
LKPTLASFGNRVVTESLSAIKDFDATDFSDFASIRSPKRCVIFFCVESVATVNC